MIKITKTIHYWLFEPISEGSPYHYIRTATEGNSGYYWFTGYESSAGKVSPAGGDLSDDQVLELEKRFQDMAKMINV